VTARRTSRPHLEPALLGRLTQGTVFNCASAFRYPGRNVLGITITARCDVAQAKYRLLNYVPAVPLSDWFLVDGLEHLVEQETAAIRGMMNGQLKNAGLSPSLLMSVSVPDIIAKNLSSQDRKLESLKLKLLECHESLSRIALLEKNPSELFDWFRENRPSRIEETIKKLFEHKLSGYYFFERLKSENALEGYVCLLREVTSLSKDVVEGLIKGLSKNQWEEIIRAGVAQNLDFSNEEFACPISQIGSPYVEHLMQSFSNLFIRIGVSDADADDIETIVSKIAYNDGVNS